MAAPIDSGADTLAPVDSADTLPPFVDPLSATGASGPPLRARARAHEAGALEVGATIGRYVVVEFLGAGGMGAVHAAYDPQLDRKVALKVLLASVGGDADQRKRLVREAQALARLQHPNVVAVHDAGEHEGRVFVAMEFVRGKTLGKWLADRREPAEIVRVFVDAGRGLAVAHAHGLVHRDFKPDNVMIDETHRVRVMDFGLARATETMRTLDELPSEPHASSSMLSLELSAAGAVAGTPAYMSPEQWAGKDVDERSDQFSYCVALFEAFAGQRPFKGASLAELATCVYEGKRVEQAELAIPGWLRRIVLRGLDPQPDRRWPSMEALLDRLDRDPRRRTRIAAASIGAIAVLGGAVAWAHTAADRTCSGGEALVATAWDDARRDRLASAFAATALPYAESARALVVGRLDAFATDFAAAHRDTCEATELRHEQSPELMDARMRCLAARFDDFAATVELLEQADAAIVERATDVVAALPTIVACADTEYVTAKVTPPDDPEVRVQVDELRKTIARARARRFAARHEDALALLDGASAGITATGYAPLQLAADYERSELAGDRGDHEAAAKGYEEIFFAARGLGLDELRTDSAIELVYEHGFALAHPDDGRQWARHANAELDVGGQPRDRVRLLMYLGSVNRRSGDTDAALRHLGEALALEESLPAPDALQLSQIRNNLCTLHHSRGELDRAEEHCRIAFDIRRAALGEEHPRVAETLNNIGGIAYARGDTDGALVSFERSAEIVRASLGEASPAYARALNNLGAVRRARGEKAEAAKYYERALAIWSAALGERHPDVAMALNNLGEVAPTPRERIAYHERALSIREAVGGPDHLDVAESLNNIGNEQQLVGDHGGALAQFERARGILVRKGDARNPRIGLLDYSMGRSLHALGRDAEALAALERALPLLRDGDPMKMAAAELALAESLPDDQRARARALVDEARGRLPDRPEATKLRAQIDAWLAAHPKP